MKVLYILNISKSVFESEVQVLVTQLYLIL